MNLWLYTLFVVEYHYISKMHIWSTNLIIMSLSSFMTYHRIVDKSNTTGAISGTRTGLNNYLLALSEHEISQLGFCGIPVAQFVAFCVVFCRSWFDFSPFNWPLCCRSFLLRLTTSDYSLWYLGIFKLS